MVLSKVAAQQLAQELRGKWFAPEQGYEVYLRGDAWRGYSVSVHDNRQCCGRGGFGLVPGETETLVAQVQGWRAGGWLRSKE